MAVPALEDVQGRLTPILWFISNETLFCDASPRGSWQEYDRKGEVMKVMVVGVMVFWALCHQRISGGVSQLKIPDTHSSAELSAYHRLGTPGIHD